MNNLVVLWFDDEFKAEEARIAFRRMQKESLVELEETAVVVKTEDGKVKLIQDVDLVGKRKNQGHWLGILAALATGIQPMILLGTAAGVLLGKLTDKGIDNKFLKEVAAMLLPGSSALFVLGKSTQRDVVIERLRPFGGKLLLTTLPEETEELIAMALEQSDS
jgi:uncharacterized membrane protein